MLVRHEREKLINAIIYFATHVRTLGKIKLFKLLYFLDFAHYRDTGRSVTGLDYNAWPKGPVPVKLFEEVSKPERDMAEKLRFSERSVKSGMMLTVTPLATFDPTHFSKRELQLMDDLCREFRDTLAEEMIEATHLENLPWNKVYVEENRKQAQIPYAYAIRKQEADAMNKVVAERGELIKHYSDS